MKKIDTVLSFIFMLVGSLVIWFSEDPEMPAMTAAFPRNLAVVLILLSLLLLASSRFGKKKTPAEKTEKQDALTLPVVLCMVLILIYCLIIEYAGYVFSTVLLVAGTIYVLGYRKPLTIAAVSFGIALFIFVVFSKLFLIPLPAGSIWG